MAFGRGPDFSELYAQLKRKALNEVSSLDFQDSEFDAELERIYNQLAITPLKILEGEIGVGLPQMGSATSNDGYGRHVLTEHTEAIVQVPFEPNPYLDQIMSHAASTFSLSGSPRFNINRPRHRFEIPLVITNPLKAQAAQQDAIAGLKQYIDWKNKDILNHNKEFHDTIKAALSNRLTSLAKGRTNLQAVIQTIGLPIKTDEDRKPVDVKVKKNIAQIRQTVTTPTGNLSESLLDPAIALDIATTMFRLGMQFEVAPQAYSKLGEEDLRHVLLGTLNAVYHLDGKAEAFNRRGKTDFILAVPQGGVFIGECKFWDGSTKFGETIDQLFSYLDWRKSYAALVIFSKLKSITTAIASAEETIKKHPSFISMENPKDPGFLFSAHRHPADNAKSIQVYSLFFDLNC